MRGFWWNWTGIRKEEIEIVIVMYSFGIFGGHHRRRRFLVWWPMVVLCWMCLRWWSGEFLFKFKFNPTFLATCWLCQKQALVRLGLVFFAGHHPVSGSAPLVHCRMLGYPLIRPLRPLIFTPTIQGHTPPSKPISFFVLILFFIICFYLD